MMASSLCSITFGFSSITSAIHHFSHFWMKQWDVRLHFFPFFQFSINLSGCGSFTFTPSPVDPEVAIPTVLQTVGSQSSATMQNSRESFSANLSLQFSQWSLQSRLRQSCPAWATEWQWRTQAVHPNTPLWTDASASVQSSIGRN